MRSARRVLVISVGVVLLVVAGAAVLSRYAPISTHFSLLLVVASPLLVLAAPVAVVVFGSGQHWIPVALSLGLTVAVIAVQLPWYVGSDPDPASVPVRLMTTNMRYGGADPDAVTRLADANADVVMVQELTPEAVAGLARAGLETSFPHRVLEARPGVSGIGLYSRHPITGVTRFGERSLLQARVRIAGVERDTTVLSVHLPAPWPQPIGGWRRAIASLGRMLPALAAEAGDEAVLIGGDFNATIDMREFRQLLTDGYRDAVWQAGNGRDVTYPANRRFPPVIGIDHVLTRNATAVATSTVELAGTDHRALLTTVMVPTG